MASPTSHAVLSPSSASRWLNCPPSARLNEKFIARYGQKSSPYAEEGTKAHAIGELKIRRSVYEADHMDVSRLSRLPPEEQDAYIGINEHRYCALRKEIGEVDESIERATDTYCDVIMNKYLAARERDDSTILMLEQRVDISKWAPGSFGSSDAILVSDSMLEVVDLKAGRGIKVSAVDNPQIRLYALGALQAFEALYAFQHVRMTIVQPRLDNLSEEVLAVEDLLSWAESTVAPRAKQAWLGLGAYHPGEHCRFCSAKAVCSARVAEALKMFQYGLEAPGLIPDEQIPEILPLLDDAEAWIQDIRAYAEAQAKMGQTIRGYKLVRGKRPNRTWADADEARAQLLRSGYSPGQFEETKLKPVGEIEKQLGKTAFRALLGGLVSQGDGKLILVPEDDPRKAYSSADAAFGDLAPGKEDGNERTGA